jgi:hypothetical protein
MTPYWRRRLPRRLVGRRKASRFADKREHLSAVKILEAEAVMDTDRENVEAFFRVWA